LEGQAAAQQKRDQIAPPDVSDVAASVNQLTLAVDAVARHVGADVRAWGGVNGLRLTRRQDLDDRARRGVARTEGRELSGRFHGENGQVRLLIRRTVPSGSAAPLASTPGC